ncbi:enoyl-CoA hydratase/isomerase family protein [Variovorax rhizosphaerae]|uniref:Enoyl-CoA hydratase/isomerase family protein n=1 Tax=Variovorax rhizosphaerae TaxID=1836200 RepID=A0ABU8WKA8_9BURK
MQPDKPQVSLITQGPVSILTLDRPERLNAIGARLLQDFHEALVAAHADPQTRVIVLTGAGRAFCAGDDLKEFGEQSATNESVAEMGRRVQQITRDIMFGPKLVIGAIHGYAVGAGFEWVLNCDMVVAADDLVAFFPEMALGQFVTGGVTHLLPRLVGHQRAVELFVLGDRFGADALQRMGLVNRVVPRDAMLSTALELGGQVAERSRTATLQLKKVMTSQRRAQLESALDLEEQAAMACFSNPDTAARVEAFVQRGKSS